MYIHQSDLKTNYQHLEKLCLLRNSVIAYISSVSPNIIKLKLLRQNTERTFRRKLCKKVHLMSPYLGHTHTICTPPTLPFSRISIELHFGGVTVWLSCCNLVHLLKGVAFFWLFAIPQDTEATAGKKFNWFVILNRDFLISVEIRRTNGIIRMSKIARSVLFLSWMWDENET